MAFVFQEGVDQYNLLEFFAASGSSSTTIQEMLDMCFGI